MTEFIHHLQHLIEEELMTTVALVKGDEFEDLYFMMAYHLGWEGKGAGPEARGKRIRPLLVLLTTAAAGGDWQVALPAAVAVELIHNFSLIHDDIEDHSPLRRGRATLWTLWGTPQAINAGDAMFTLAHLALLRLGESVSPQVAHSANRILQQTCLSLTQGQFLDMVYEKRNDLTLTAYWQMINGKTAALLAACTHLGAIAAEAGQETCVAYRQFGLHLGLAFQAQDDLLGIWGDENLTGKSNQSDLLAGKKTLPVLYGLSQGGLFARRWQEGVLEAHEIGNVAEQLEREGARAFTQERANELTQSALDALDKAQPQGPAGIALRELALSLLKRKA